MPTSPGKARRLLKKGRAMVVRRLPFTIQLTYGGGEARQAIRLGVDGGYKYIGLSAITEKEEVFRGEVCLRGDIVKLISKRRQYRKKRRYRSNPYRKKKLCRGKMKSGWLAPSIRHKLDSHLRIIEKIGEMIPVSKIIVETGSFDIQKIKNPFIEGKGYQNGEQRNFGNVREYVLYRDNHVCQYCRGKSKNPALEVHHIESRQSGGNRPDNLVTLCADCHRKVSQGKFRFEGKISKGFRGETFMSLIRKRLVSMLKNKGYDVRVTYGYITKAGRGSLRLSKSHANDAFVIAGGERQPFSRQYAVKQNRRNNRRLQTNRKGFKPSIRRKRYKYQPGDLVRYGNINYEVKGVFNYGTWIRLKGVDGKIVNMSVSKIKLVKYGRGFVFSL